MHSRDLRLLLYFAEIVDSGSIRGAARALSVSPPVVSTALKDLEDLIGVTLLRRTTRRLDLTDIGTRVYADADAMRRNAGAAMTVAAEKRSVSGTLRISAPVELASYWLPSLLSTYRDRWPEVRFCIEALNTLSDPQRSRVDLSIRATFQKDDKEARPLNPIAVLPLDLVCRPELAPGTGSLADRLRRTGYIGTGSDFGYTLTAWTADGQEERAVLDVAQSSEDRLTVLSLARAGMGAALLIRDTVAPDLRRGRLIRVAPHLDFGVVAIRALPTDPQPAPPVLAFLRLLDDTNRSPDPALTPG